MTNQRLTERATSPSSRPWTKIMVFTCVRNRTPVVSGPVEVRRDLSWDSITRAKFSDKQFDDLLFRKEGTE